MMNHLKKRLITVCALAFVVGLMGSCSKEDTPPVTPVTPEPPVVTPETKPITLTQLTASLGEPAAVPTMRAVNPEQANAMKTAFLGGDFFSLTYNASKSEGMLVTYAHTTDGKSWVFRKSADASSDVQTVTIASDNTALKAAYVPLAAAGAVDGIVAGADNTVTCYDALQALGDATISDKTASASLHFTHTNHLLRFSVSGDASVADVRHLLLTLNYTDATGKPLTATLETAFKAEYTSASGNKQNVIQAIVPREALLKGITVVFSSGKLLVANDPEHSSAELACPGGKSRLIPLTVKNEQLTMQPGNISAGWADGGTINADGQLGGDIYINSLDDLIRFRDAVNTNPNSDGAKINGIRAYQANVVQTADIDLGSIAQWEPIGGASYDEFEDPTSFQGTYNGNGYTISNMKVTSLSVTGNGITHYGGLFGWVKSSATKSVVLVGIHLRNASVKATSSLKNIYQFYAGALAGRIDGSANHPTVVSLCSAAGTVETKYDTGKMNVGGLIGGAEYTHITRCTIGTSATATATETTSVGGVCGAMRRAYIVSCYAQGAVHLTAPNSTANAGGIVGDVSDVSSVIMACRADGTVTAEGGTVNAGGLVGSGEGTLVGSFAKGAVTGNATGAGRVGAIIGENYTPGKFALCYGASANDAGSSRNAGAKAESIVYKVNPSAGEILAVVDGSAWENAQGRQNDEAFQGGVLTPVGLFAFGKYSTRVLPRLWVLLDISGSKMPWSATSQGGTALYPAPLMNYEGQ